MALGGALLHGGRYIVPGRYNSCIFKVWAMASSWTLDRLPVGTSPLHPHPLYCSF